MKKMLNGWVAVVIPVLLLLASCDKGSTIGGYSSGPYSSIITWYLDADDVSTSYEDDAIELRFVGSKRYERGSAEHTQLSEYFGDTSWNGYEGDYTGPREVLYHPVASIEVTSGVAFNDYPPMTLLNDVVVLKWYSIKPYIDSGYPYCGNPLDEWVAYESPLSQMDDVKMALASPYMYLSFTEVPEIKTQHLIITIYDTAGNVITVRCEYTFSDDSAEVL